MHRYIYILYIYIVPKCFNYEYIYICRRVVEKQQQQGCFQILVIDDS